MKYINIVSMKAFFILSSIILISAACHQPEATIAKEDITVINVSASEVGVQNNPNTITATGKIKSANRVNVAARMMGYAQSLPIEVGDQIKKGQLIARISTEELNNQKAQVEAGITEINAMIENVDANYARIKSLYDKKSATQKELDDIKTQKDASYAKRQQAEEKIKEIQTMMSYATVTSPMSGVVVEKMVEQGELVSPGRPILAIEASDEHEALLMIPESQISTISKGMSVSLALKSTGEQLKGKVSQIGTSALHTGGQYPVTVQLDKSTQNKNLYSGMYVTAELVNVKEVTQPTAEQNIFVPKESIVQQGQLTGVYTITDDNRAMMRYVRIGKETNSGVEILSGISQGERFISEADSRLYNGAKVNIQ